MRPRLLQRPRGAGNPSQAQAVRQEAFRTELSEWFFYNNLKNTICGFSDPRMCNDIAIRFTSYMVHDCNVSNNKPKEKHGPYVAISVPFRIYIKGNPKLMLWDFTSDVLQDIMSPTFEDTSARHDV